MAEHQSWFFSEKAANNKTINYTFAVLGAMRIVPGGGRARRAGQPRCRPGPTLPLGPKLGLSIETHFANATSVKILGTQTNWC